MAVPLNPEKIFCTNGSMILRFALLKSAFKSRELFAAFGANMPFMAIIRESSRSTLKSILKNLFMLSHSLVMAKMCRV